MSAPAWERLPKRIRMDARHMLKAGLGWDDIAVKLGLSRHVVRMGLDPDYRNQRRAHERARPKRHRQKLPPTPHVADSVRQAARDAVHRLAEIPPDTRTLTARAFGDPLPGRSALDRKRMQAP